MSLTFRGGEGSGATTINLSGRRSFRSGPRNRASCQVAGVTPGRGQFRTLTSWRRYARQRFWWSSTRSGELTLTIRDGMGSFPIEIILINFIIEYLISYLSNNIIRNKTKKKYCSENVWRSCLQKYSYVYYSHLILHFTLFYSPKNPVHPSLPDLIKTDVSGLKFKIWLQIWYLIFIQTWPHTNSSPTTPISYSY